MGLMLATMLVNYITRKKQHENKYAQFHTKETPTTWSGLYRFSKTEIVNFLDERNCLGRGSADEVYKGTLPGGQVVVVKQINTRKNSCSFISFMREVEGLSRIRHPNIVRVFGCYIEDGKQYLVHEDCPAGNLAYRLFRKDSVLTWEKRVKILRDCALAIRFLHHHIDGCIVHRDIKLTNILLTENLDPKLLDFGLAKVIGMKKSKLLTENLDPKLLDFGLAKVIGMKKSKLLTDQGTIGYMDPEYMSSGKFTCASDIYSFGIVALQLLSGQKVIELDLEARNQLTIKAKNVVLGKRPLTDFEDPRLNGDLNRVDFESILQVAVLCIAKSSKCRPTIDIVFVEMDKAWQNTVADRRTKEMKSLRVMQQVKSLDVQVIPP